MPMGFSFGTGKSVLSLSKLEGNFRGVDIALGASLVGLWMRSERKRSDTKHGPL